MMEAMSSPVVGPALRGAVSAISIGFQAKSLPAQALRNLRLPTDGFTLSASARRAGRTMTAGMTGLGLLYAGANAYMAFRDGHKAAGAAYVGAAAGQALLGASALSGRLAAAGTTGLILASAGTVAGTVLTYLKR